MADGLTRFELKIDALLRRLDELDHRLGELEGRFSTLGLPPPGGFTPPAVPVRPDLRLAAAGYDSHGTASLVGRTFLVLGGAYLLRALTDSGLLPRPLGVALGLVYAIIWIALADRAGAAQRRPSALFHGIAAAAVAFPLLYEAMVKFSLLSFWGGAAALSVIAALALAVAANRWLHAMAWVVSLAGMATAVALMRASESIAPFCLFLIFIAVVAYWFSHVRGWWLLRWPVALGADAAVLWLSLRAVGPGTWDIPELALLVQLVLFGAFITSFAIRTLVLARDVGRFEIVQSIAILLFGIGGGAYVALKTAGQARDLGILTLFLGAVTYGVAFGVVARRWQPVGRNLTFYSTVALALTVIGGSLIFPPPVAAAAWVGLALAGASLGRRYTRVALSVHGAVYLVAAAAASGLLLSVTYGLLMPADRPWRSVAPVALLALAGAALCSAMSPSGVRTLRSAKVATARIAGRAYVGIPRAVALAVLVVGLAGVLVIWIVKGMAGAPGPDSAGIIATIRTAILAGAIVIMGFLARGDRVPEAAWLIYPLALAAGLKVLLEDFRQSEPATLFMALVLYGVALIVAPRLAARGTSPSHGGAA